MMCMADNSMEDQDVQGLIFSFGSDRGAEGRARDAWLKIKPVFCLEKLLLQLQLINS